MKMEILHLKRWRSVRFWPVNHISESAQNVMEPTWQPENRYRLVRLSVSLRLSRSESQVPSLPCVPSIPVVWPVMISRRVFLVSKSFLRQENRKDLRSLQNLAVLQQSTIQRRNVRLLWRIRRRVSRKLIWFRMVHELRLWMVLFLKPVTSWQKVVSIRMICWRLRDFVQHRIICFRKYREYIVCRV